MENRILKKIQVNIPFQMLQETYLPRFIELGLNPEIGLDAVALDAYGLADFQRVADALRERGLRITLHGPFVDLAPGSPDPAVWDLTKGRFEQVLRLIPLFGPETLVCHAGYDHNRYQYLADLWLEKSVALWTWLAQGLKGEGTLLTLENVYEQDPGEMKMLYDQMDAAPAGFCLDTGHLHAFGRAPLTAWLEIMGDRVTQIHLHDNNGHEDEHLALGRGSFDFRTLFEYLQKERKEPPLITVEPHREEDLWPTVAFLERVWPW
jgi:sugar phosphate isomerase/epimerase